MFYTQHQAGQGCTTFLADAMILEISSKIMQDWFKEYMQETSAAQQVAQSNAQASIKQGQIDAKKALQQGLFKMAGALAGATVTIAGTIKTLKESAPLAENRSANNNINETIKALQTPPADAQVNSSQGVPDAVYVTTGNRPQLIKAEVKKWCDDGCKKPLDQITFTDDAAGHVVGGEHSYAVGKEALSLLSNDDKREIITMLNNKKDDIAIENKMIGQKIHTLANFSALSNQITSLIEGAGQLATMNLDKDRATLDAVKTLLSQNQEFVKEVMTTLNQGENNNFEAMKNALQQFEQVVAASTRV